MSSENSDSTTSVNRVVHTPGPWMISTWSFNPGKGKPASIYAGHEGMDEVAICQFDREPDSPETIEADARLIAAAPDMLEVLRMVRKYGQSGETNEDVHQFVDEVIRKATGESV